MTDIEAASAALNRLLTVYGVTRDQMADLLGGSADGGPAGDGRYPVTLANGLTTLIPCPARIALSLGDPAAALAAIEPKLVAALAAADRAEAAVPAAVRAETARDQAVAVSSKVASLPTGRNEFVLVDGDGNTMFRIGPDRLEYPPLDALLAKIPDVPPVSALPTGSNEVVLVDGDGGVVWRFDADTAADYQALKDGSNGEGTMSPAAMSRIARREDRRDPAYDTIAATAELMHSVIGGQSNGAGVVAQPAISTSVTPGGFTFKGGVRYSTDAAFDPADLQQPPVPLVERDHANAGETIASGSTQMLAQLLQEEDGIDFAASGQKLLWSSAAIPGASIDLLDGPDVGGSPFHGTVDNFSFGKTMGLANGMPYAPLSFDWVQGEANQVAETQAYYDGKLRAFVADLQSAVQAAIGTDRPLPWLTYQTPTVPDSVADGSLRPAAALAQAAVAKSTTYVAMVVAPYFLKFAGATDVHFTAEAQRIMGAYFGLAKKRWFWDGIKPRMMTIRKARAYGKCIIADLDVPSGYTAVIDTARFPGLANAGVTLATSSGAAIAVTGVSIIGGRRIKIETASTRSAGDLVRYGWAGNGVQLQGAIRDTAGDDLIFDPEGIAYPMHSWLEISEEICA